MLESFKDEIPNLEALVKKLRQAINDPSQDLESIREIIYEHIIENIEHVSEKDMEEAMATAFNAVEELICELEVNKVNFNRLKDYIKGYYSYNAYNRLIMDFSDYMSENERLHLIKEGRKIFVKEITQHWE